MQSALGEGNREGDDSYANSEDQDKETDVLGVSLQMLETAADFLLGPRERFPEYDDLPLRRPRRNNTGSG